MDAVSDKAGRNSEAAPDRAYLARRPVEGPKVSSMNGHPLTHPSRRTLVHRNRLSALDDFARRGHRRRKRRSLGDSQRTRQIGVCVSAIVSQRVV